MDLLVDIFLFPWYTVQYIGSVILWAIFISFIAYHINMDIFSDWLNMIVKKVKFYFNKMRGKQ